MSNSNCEPVKKDPGGEMGENNKFPLPKIVLSSSSEREGPFFVELLGAKSKKKG